MVVVVGTTNIQQPPQQVRQVFLLFVLIIIDVDYVETAFIVHSPQFKWEETHPKWYAMIYYFAKSLIPLTHFIFLQTDQQLWNSHHHSLIKPSVFYR
jgi:hypothetical protein